MIFIKKTSKFFDKKENNKKEENSKTDIDEILEEVSAASDFGDDKIWEPKTEEEVKQKAVILEIRKLMGQDTKTPIKLSDIKKLEAEKLEAEKKVVTEAVESKQTTEEDDDEIWKPKTEEEKLQYASMLKIRKLLGQDTNIPIKKSEVRKTEPVSFAPSNRILEEKAVESTGNVWKPQTEEEKRQQAAILKIRELLGEDTTVPIEKQQKVKAQMISAMGQEEEPVKRDPKVIIRCGEEKEEQSSQYLLLKKLLEEDDKKTGAKKPAGGEKTGQVSPQPIVASSFGIGNVFTVGAIRNAEHNKSVKKDVNEKKFEQPATRSSVEYSVNAKSKEEVDKKADKAQTSGYKIHSEEQEYIRPPEAKNPNSPFFLFDFKDLIK